MHQCLPVRVPGKGDRVGGRFGGIGGMEIRDGVVLKGESERGWEARLGGRPRHASQSVPPTDFVSARLNWHSNGNTPASGAAVPLQGQEPLLLVHIGVGSKRLPQPPLAQRCSQTKNTHLLSSVQNPQTVLSSTLQSSSLVGVLERGERGDGTLARDEAPVNHARKPEHGEAAVLELSKLIPALKERTSSPACESSDTWLPQAHPRAQNQ